MRYITLIKFRVTVPSHGSVSYDPAKGARVTRDYIEFLRQQMGRAARSLDDFDDAYSEVD